MSESLFPRKPGRPRKSPQFDFESKIDAIADDIADTALKLDEVSTPPTITPQVTKEETLPEQTRLEIEAGKKALDKYRS